MRKYQHQLGNDIKEGAMPECASSRFIDVVARDDETEDLCAGMQCLRLAHIADPWDDLFGRQGENRCHVEAAK